LAFFLRHGNLRSAFACRFGAAGIRAQACRINKQVLA